MNATTIIHIMRHVRLRLWRSTDVVVNTNRETWVIDYWDVARLAPGSVDGGGGAQDP